MPKNDLQEFSHNRDPYRTVAGRQRSRGPIVEAKKWIAVTDQLEFVN
jgi:hypothetical protein